MAKAAPILVLLLAANLAAAQEQAPRFPIKGRVSLAGMGKGSYASIDGEWEFFWRRFVEPGAAHEKPDAYVRFPGLWEKYPIAGTSPQGYATYRLRLENLDPGIEWSIRLASLLSAGRLYANGVFVGAIGEPGKDAVSESPQWDSSVIKLGAPRGGIIDLVLYMSNFADRSGGSKTRIFVGDFDAVLALRARNRLFSMFLFGALMTMGLYYFCLHIFRPQAPSNFYFSVFCLVLALRTLCYDEYLLRFFWPSLSWPWLFRLGYLSFSLGLFFFAGYVRYSYRRYFSKIFFVIIAMGSFAYSALCLLVPPLIASRSLYLFQAFVLVFGFYSIYAIIRGIVARQSGALILGLGLFIFFAAVIHDILITNGILSGPFFAQAGVFIFLFLTSNVITRNFIQDYARTESLSGQLARGNKAMRRFVPGEFLALFGKSSIEEVGLGEHRAGEMTIMFVDICRFPALAEKMEPQELFNFINKYLARVSPSIRSNGGFVDKYLGKRIMAIFPDSPDDALRCSIEIQRRINEYNKQRSSGGGASIQVGIGIHYGKLMLGTIGESERMDGAIISDAVDIAAQLEDVCGEYEVGIAVSERVLIGLADPSAYKTRFLGRIGVKALREPLSIFEIYDGDGPELIEKKDRARPFFERALHAFYEQRFPEAFRLFDTALNALPGDAASEHYMAIIRKRGQA